MENFSEEIIRVAVVGPECTGKSTLSAQLAIHYHTVFVPEYAREYIDKLKRLYTPDDIVAISKGQLEAEDRLAASAHKLLVCDTNLIVTKIWAEYKYHHCPEWIKTNLLQRKYDLHLLTYIDVPWEYDPQREHPNKREELFHIYRKELDALGVNYKVILGEPARRLQLATEAINSLLKS